MSSVPNNVVKAKWKFSILHLSFSLDLFCSSFLRFISVKSFVSYFFFTFLSPVLSFLFSPLPFYSTSVLKVLLAFPFYFFPPLRFRVHSDGKKESDSTSVLRH